MLLEYEFIVKQFRNTSADRMSCTSNLDSRVSKLCLTAALLVIFLWQGTLRVPGYLLASQGTGQATRANWIHRHCGGIGVRFAFAHKPAGFWRRLELVPMTWTTEAVAGVKADRSVVPSFTSSAIQLWSSWHWPVQPKHIAFGICVLSREALP